jgi:dephospho-CoA kinase
MNKLLVGITGGIGSGKTTVARIISKLGFPVFEADEVAKKILNQDESIRKAVVSLLGDEVYLPDGTANRTVIASRVFGDSEKLNQLNAIIHPAVATKFTSWVDTQKQQVLFKEAAILFESGSNKGLHRIIGVLAPEKIRINRVVQRDQRSPEQIKSIIERQMPEEDLEAKCDFIILNDGTHPLLVQVLKIIEQLTRNDAEN